MAQQLLRIRNSCFMPPHGVTDAIDSSSLLKGLARLMLTSGLPDVFSLISGKKARRNTLAMLCICKAQRQKGLQISTLWVSTDVVAEDMAVHNFRIQDVVWRAILL